MSRAFAGRLLLAALVVPSCVDAIDTAQRKCPCAGQDVCCAALDACVSSPQQCPSADAASEGGAPECGLPASRSSEVIDDMEDLDSQLSGYPGAGSWSLAHDDSPGAWQLPEPSNPRMTEIPGGRCESRFALHTEGGGFRTWGALAGLVFHSVMLDGGEWSSTAIDASAYRGFRFWARVGAGTTPTLVVAATDVNTVPAGGRCVDATQPPDAGDDVRCWNYFAETLTLSDEWVEYRVLFADLHQQLGWGLRGAPLAVDQLHGLNFMVPPHGQAFDVWIDDIRWITTD